ncbi:hypothetical protein FACHB389_14140 [Nostoc calcicola FACHB-389]|nr:S8 family serine peptidase [Nostoc calcicola FACHB-3891]OKH34877.1 hypothetical protein FACHB389_14140 [Nostoc calcicola FACHB-389]
MSVYIIRSQISLARSLNVQSQKFTPESRNPQIREVVNFWREEPAYQQIKDWLQDAENKNSEVIRYPDYSGITGASVVEMSDKEAARIRKDLPDVSILRDRLIELIHPLQSNTDAQDEFSTDELWHLDAIALNIARQNGFGRTGKNVTIAVLDTGIDSNHRELQGQVTKSYSLNDRTKEIQLTPSQDTNGHGTHVAGLICGKHVGVAPETKLIDGLLLPKGISNLSNFVIWLNWLALQQDVNIVNISAGLRMYADEMSDVIDTLLAVGILPVCAVGNDGRNNTRTPGNCRNSISVGATNFNNQVASFSGSGKMSVNNLCYDVPNLVAPGEGVYSSVPGDKYKVESGTSMATPIVSGVAALILEKYNKNISVLNLIEALLTSCKDLGVDKERQGRGLIQVTAAL